MEQKLHHLLHSVSPRAAWITAGSCVCFWLVSLTGVLTPPLTAPAYLTLFWFYATLMLALASGVAAIGAAAVLLAGRRERGSATSAATPAAAAPDSPDQDAADQEPEDDPDQPADLRQLLDNPGPDRH